MMPSAFLVMSSVSIANINDLNELNAWDALSISLWVNVEPSQSGYLIRRENDLGEVLFSIHMNAFGNYVVTLTDNEIPFEIMTTDSYDDGSWHHLLLSIERNVQDDILYRRRTAG